MFTIAGLVGWIILDLGMFLVTTPPALSPWLWYGFLVVGLIVGVLALIGEIRDRNANAREMAELKAGQDALAGAALKTLETSSNMALLVQRLEGLTNTHGAPIVTTIEMATSKIEGLEQQIRVLNERAARRISADQRRKFRESLSGKIPWIREMYCISLDSEAEAYAKQLTRMFREAGMNAGYSFLVDNFDSPTLEQFGLTIHHKIGEFPDDARDLAWALDQAGIKYGLTTERVVAHADPHYVGLRVGRKPE
jgi:hypothetical protein